MGRPTLGSYTAIPSPVPNRTEWTRGCFPQKCKFPGRHMPLAQQELTPRLCGALWVAKQLSDDLRTALGCRVFN